MQEKISYKEIMDLGFKEKIQSDDVYFNEYGYKYAIITFKLTKKISLDWSKETQLCKLIRIDSPKKQNVLATRPVENLTHLKWLVDFFTKKDNAIQKYL